MQHIQGNYNRTKTFFFIISLFSQRFKDTGKTRIFILIKLARAKYFCPGEWKSTLLIT